jgi:hypothetical protein
MLILLLYGHIGCYDFVGQNFILQIQSLISHRDAKSLKEIYLE